jgi:hypothetical protein
MWIDGCDHAEVILESQALANRNLSHAVLRASDFPLGAAVHAETAEILEDRSHPATGLLNRCIIENMLTRPLGTTSSLPDRAGFERVRSLAAWVKDYGITLELYPAQVGKSASAFRQPARPATGKRQ